MRADSAPLMWNWRGLSVSLALLMCLPASLAIGANGPPVTVARAEMRPIVHVARLAASVVSPRSAGISSAVGGLVESVEVDLGDAVERGDKLVQLDRALALQEVRMAEAALSEAEAVLADENRRLRVAERLIKRGNVPQNELEARQAQVRIANAAVERLKAEAALQRERLRRHAVTAPFAGVVARKVTEAGEWVSPGATVIQLVSTQDLRIDIPVPQRYFPQLATKAPVHLEFDALPGKTFEAERVALVPVSDPRARTFTLRVRILREAAALTPGMSARAAIHLDSGEQGIVIPRDAVLRHPDGRVTVWVVADQDQDEAGGDGGNAGESARVAERQVILGRGFDGMVHVKEGLEVGERVVVRGNESLRKGQQVRIVDGSSS